jgi:hypothetical protein
LNRVAAAFVAMKRGKGATMIKLAIGAAAMALAVAGFAFAAGIGGGDDDRGRTTSSTTAHDTTGTTTANDRFDDRNRRGHKAEKAKLRRKHARALRNRLREPGEDVRGPCDEAEHANDPRCTGAAPAGGDRRGDDDRGRDDHGGRGRSGGNSGPG